MPDNPLVTPIKNDRLLRALNRQKVDRPPVWLMRQAGRYLPEYREVRKQAGDFMSLCKNPELCCEVAMQPIDRFGLDAAILFSDILTIPDAMGLGLGFVENHGPKFERRVKSRSDIDALPVIDPHDSLDYVIKAVDVTKRTLAGSIPLIGFAGSPWTLATYMIEGQSSRTFPLTKALIYSHPESADTLLEKLSQNIIAYLSAQVIAGADVLMIFDTWGGALSTHSYQRFSLTPMAKIVTALKQQHPGTPVILFTKGGGAWLESMVMTGCDGLGLDWGIDIASAMDRVGDKVALQGNLDPGVLYGSDRQIEREVKAILDAVSGRCGHIFNLGHGIEPGINPEKVKLMINTVHNYYGG